MNGAPHKAEGPVTQKHGVPVFFGMFPVQAKVARAAVREVPPSAWDDVLDASVASGALHVLEADYARTLPEARRATFVAGREALRAAMAELSVAERALASGGEHGPILRNHRGAPALPAAVAGSVSHKRTLAMAAVMPRASTLQYVGLDLERRPTERDLESRSVASKILTGREYEYVQQWGDHTLEGREQVLVHFALKEAVYKAIDPYVERYVRFTEVELALSPSGTADVTLLLPEPAVANVRVHASWTVEGEWIVAWAESHERRG